jgi:hypothetical protein
MEDSFTDFIIDIASDTEMLEAFRYDSEATMKPAKLSEAQKAVLKSGNPTLIRNAMASNDDVPVVISMITR